MFRKNRQPNERDLELIQHLVEHGWILVADFDLKTTKVETVKSANFNGPFIQLNVEGEKDES